MRVKFRTRTRESGSFLKPPRCRDGFDMRLGAHFRSTARRCVRDESQAKRVSDTRGLFAAAQIYQDISSFFAAFTMIDRTANEPPSSRTSRRARELETHDVSVSSLSPLPPLLGVPFALSGSPDYIDRRTLLHMSALTKPTCADLPSQQRLVVQGRPVRVTRRWPKKANTNTVPTRTVTWKTEASVETPSAFPKQLLSPTPHCSDVS